MPQSAPICHNCTKKYSKDPPTIPILLNCGHTYCEGCITRFGRLIKGKGNITCPECAEYHYIESLKSIKQLQINAHIYGVITAPNRKTENAVDAMEHAELANKLTDLARQQSSDEEEAEEEDGEEYTPCCESNCKAKSTIQCSDCGDHVTYCSSCSDNAHRLFAMRDHRPEPIKPKALFEQCGHHPDTVPTQCLKKDGKPVCPLCPPAGETVDLICESDQIEDLIQKHNLALEKLEESDQSISTDLIPAIEQDFLRLKSEVRKEFGYFHGVLQAREQTLLEELEAAHSNTVDPLLKYRSEIVKTKKTARKNFNLIQRYKNSKNVLIRKQFEVQNFKTVIDDTKCTLYVQSEKKPTLSTKKGMLAKCISEFCKLHADDVHRYVIDTVDSTKARRYNEEVPQIAQPVESDWESSISLSQVSVSSEPLTVKLTTAENKDKVVVSVVYTPQCFYVQRINDRNDLDELQNVLVKYYGLSVTSEDYLRSVSPGDVVCCKFTVDEFWYRARVLESDATSANVLYIDYGNCEIVPLSRLRRLKTQFTHVPAMAIKCALFDITPRSGNTWTQESVESFKSLTAENQFEMITKGKLLDCTEVDLLRCGSDNYGSTREFLVFLEHACFSTTKPSVDHGSEDKDEKDVIVQIDAVQAEPVELTWPESDEEYTLVTVSHIESPHHFFVQFESSSDLIQDIEKGISSHMKLTGKKFPLKELKKGVMCLALFPGDGSYYRAVIMGAMIGFNVQVLYCDYGNSEEVDRSELYEIPRSLAAPPRQSMACSLFEIAPKEDSWSMNEVVMFEQLVADRLLFAGHRGVEKGACLVSLIDTTQSSEDIDIAEDLIKRGFGISTVPPDKPPAMPQQQSMVPMGEISLGDVNSTRETTICHVTNPHLIHVNLKDFPYPPFFKKFNETYARFVKSDNLVIERNTSWNIGDICVAYLSDHGLYIRAKIVSFQMPQSAQVVNIDQGRVSTVSLRDLKVLIEDFSLIRQPKFAVSCRLYDLAPVDGRFFTEDQRKKVVKFFSKRVKRGNAGCFVTVMGVRDTETGAWPVDMVLEDPVRKTRERVSPELVKLGVAQFIVDKVAAPHGSDYKQVELGLLERHGKVIHVSSNCTIYFTPDSMRPNKERLATFLESFQSTPANVDWQVGAACVAKSDRWFNRGIVTHIIGPKMLEILVVDTGISMNVHVKDVYPVLLCPDIPKLAVPLKLAYTQPAWHCSDGINWGQPAKAFLYEQVVNEKCEVDVVKNEGECYRASLKLASGQEVSDIMVRKGFAVSMSPEKLLPPSAKTSSTVGPLILPSSTAGNQHSSNLTMPPQTTLHLSPILSSPGPPSSSIDSFSTTHQLTPGVMSPAHLPGVMSPAQHTPPGVMCPAQHTPPAPAVMTPPHHTPFGIMTPPHHTTAVTTTPPHHTSAGTMPLTHHTTTGSMPPAVTCSSSLINEETRELLDGF